MSAKGCKCQRSTRAKEGSTCTECKVEETNIDEIYQNVGKKERNECKVQETNIDEIYQNIGKKEISENSPIIYDDIQENQFVIT